MMMKVSLEFLQDVLKDCDVSIQSFESAPAAHRGDNYTSMVYRINLKGIQKQIQPNGSSEIPWESSIIYKCLPESTFRREAFKSDDLFFNEVAFYNKVWPALLDFQKKRGVVSPFKAIPKCYLAQSDLVILKDLKPIGFVMPDRREGLSIEQCYFVLKHIAQFHAISLAMKIEDPEEFYELLNKPDGISEAFYSEKNIDYYRTFFHVAINNAKAMIEEELKDHSEKRIYLEKFEEFCDENFFQKMVDLLVPEEPLALINHGDFWMNNLLFKYVNGDIAEMCIVDFQLVRYTSPTIDLVFLLYLCLDRVQRSAHLSSLLDYYVEELHKRLVELSDKDGIFQSSLDKNTLNDMIRKELKRTSRFSLGLAVNMYPILTCDGDEAPNLYEEKENGDVPSHDCVTPVVTSNESCSKKMADLLIELVDGGIL